MDIEELCDLFGNSEEEILSLTKSKSDLVKRIDGFKTMQKAIPFLRDPSKGRDVHGIKYSFVERIDEEDKRVINSDRASLHSSCSECGKEYPVINEDGMWEEGVYEDPDDIKEDHCFVACPEHGLTRVFYHKRIF